MVATAGTPRARALSAALRDARETRGVGLRVLARQLEISHTQISHWETGHRVPGVEVVAMILAALRVPPGERERILDLARNLGEPSWLTVGISGIPQQLAGAIECERAASAIVEWSPMGVPGLLQTSDYSRAILEEADLPEHDLDVRAMIRASRSEVLSRPEPLEFEALVSEAALHEPIGSPRIMRSQITHLLHMSEKPNVVIRIVPLRAGWHPGWSGPFVIYDFPSAPSVVHFEHYSSGAFIPVEHDLREYRKAVVKIREVTLSPADSLDYLVQAGEKWEVG
ncbi:helix-turn-helix domain-containing protein [Saccharopolyspora gregorii]|uniref:helix-turn-helix domain-containing protein n=1 Tax=Saccharopolyspora gregorii TaxID=33914 RepID=UPI0021ABD74B|nr:helix-turn-helix transcriptional regulator [Saccharopolyspora gregorii]